MRIRKATVGIALVGLLVIAGAAAPAFAASASISPNTQTTTGSGHAHWTMSWSGGSTTKFYPNANGSLGWITAAASLSYTFNSCPSTYTVGQELDVYSGSTLVAGATSSTTVKHATPCSG